MKLTTDEKKAKFLEYFRDLPIIKLAAGHAGVTDDTITNWKKDDEVFSEQVELAKSDWAMKNASKVRNKEWLLERIMKNHFAQRNEMTGADGKDLPTPIAQINVSTNDGVPKDK